MSQFVWLAIVLLAVLTACTQAGSATPTADPDAFYAPEISLDTLDGGPVRLSDFRGKWVALNFWATWCAPCVEEMPALQALADAYPDDLVVLGVNLREDAAAVRAFADTYDIRFPLLLNPADATVLAYSVVGLPQTLLINPQGVVVQRAFGSVDVAGLERQLAAVPGD